MIATARFAESVPAKLIVLSSSLLTERMLLHSSFLGALEGRADLRIWTSAADTAERTRSIPSGIVEPMPQVKPFPEFPHAYLRRLNDFAWDARLRAPSRISMMRHVRSKTLSLSMRALRAPASAIAALKLEGRYETWLEDFLLSHERSTDATKRLTENRPALLLATGPQRYEEPAVIASAKRLRIPTLALITSWDNITTKNRIPFRHDGYIVWSAQMRKELLEFYPETDPSSIYVVGAPQFDVFFQDRFRESRGEFCNRVGLRADRPIILYALGSPNFLKEHHGALFLAKRVQEGELGDVQLLVRPHPLFSDGHEATAFNSFGDRVRVQQTGRSDVPTAERTQKEADITDWVSTFRNVDVVINLSSTATVDAAICDRPVVNLDFDPEPGQPNAGLVHDVNHLWTHFRPIAESGGVWLVRNPADMIGAVREYLVHPELHAAKRRWIAHSVCGYLDGRCGERLANSLLEFVESRVKRAG